jgi:ADP-heptose:LPS heptosyltransferase
MLRTWRRPVLFERQGALGDIICTFPAVLQLKKRHPKAAFVYSCHRDFVHLPEMGAITKHVTTASFDKGTVWSFFFEEIYHFRYGDEIDGCVSTRTIIEEFCVQHGVAVTDEHPHLKINPQALSRVRSLLLDYPLSVGPLVFFHLGPSWPVREWAHACWIDLARALESQGFSNIILLGVDKHVELGTVPGFTVPGVVSLVNRLTVEETAALVSIGGLLVGIDSGLLHLAASTDTPAVGIFGATSPEFRFSRNSSCVFVASPVECQGCHHRLPRLHWKTGCPYDIKCMKTINVSSVVQACLLKLASKETGSLPACDGRN